MASLSLGMLHLHLSAGRRRFLSQLTDRALNSIFQTPWDKILQSADAIASSHQLYASNIEKDVEQALRAFQNRREMQNINTISTNLQSMAKELDEAQERSAKLTKKGGRANAQKVDQATSRLEAAQQQWESQAPFIFESLQALDEQRVNHLRDVLTQLMTHEVDQAARTQTSAEDVLNTLLEVQTDQEIKNFVNKTTASRAKLEKGPASTRQGSAAGTPSLAGRTSSLAPASISGHRDDDDVVSEHSGFREKEPGGACISTSSQGSIPCETIADVFCIRIETAQPHRHNAGTEAPERARRFWPAVATEECRFFHEKRQQQSWPEHITARVVQQSYRFSQPAPVSVGESDERTTRLGKSCGTQCPRGHQRGEGR